jgi:porphobilinogen synthase
MSLTFPTVRMRRLRQSLAMRDLLTETRLSVKDFVMPLFIQHGNNIRNPVDSMPGLFQLSVDQLDQEIKEISELGIPAVILFGLPEYKDADGSASWQDNGVVQNAIRKIKKIAPELLVMVDTCFCEYTSHGHCGVVENNDVENDKTVENLVKQAVIYAKAGAEVIAPSGMIDGMVAAIRQGLDQAGFPLVAILSYSTKYASNFYGPFRCAVDCGLQAGGDRKTYQMSPTNAREGLRETLLDVEEGADMLMVKPGMPYLDIVYRVKQAYPTHPLGIYQVSGEYSMIKAAAEKGWINEKAVMMESLIAMRRAGADFIITYFAIEAARLLTKG